MHKKIPDNETPIIIEKNEKYFMSLKFFLMMLIVRLWSKTFELLRKKITAKSFKSLVYKIIVLINIVDQSRCFFPNSYKIFKNEF